TVTGRCMQPPKCSRGVGRGSDRAEISLATTGVKMCYQTGGRMTRRLRRITMRTAALAWMSRAISCLILLLGFPVALHAEPRPTWARVRSSDLAGSVDAGSPMFSRSGMEFGIALGTPAAIDLGVGYWTRTFGFRVTGGNVGNLSGV